jgi:hypothetical protein
MGGEIRLVGMIIPLERHQHETLRLQAGNHLRRGSRLQDRNHNQRGSRLQEKSSPNRSPKIAPFRYFGGALFIGLLVVRDAVSPQKCAPHNLRRIAVTLARPVIVKAVLLTAS